MLVAFFQVEMMATVAESVDYLSEAILNKCKRSVLKIVVRFNLYRQAFKDALLTALTAELV